MRLIFKQKQKPFLERNVVIKKDQTTLKQKPNENAINCNIMVPKWVVGLSVIAFAFIFTVFIAAIAIVYAAPRPGLYGESCATRSCLKGFDLKCINGVCLCPGQDYYYGIKCTPKRNYMETCSRTVPCKNGSNLVCRNGKCDCNTTNYWNGTYCEIKESYKGHCNSDKGCQYNLLLYCNKTTKTCLCDSSHYWDGTACTKKRGYLETCQLSTDCKDSQHTICANKKCSCISTKYWDSLYSMCLDFISENSSCVSSPECFSPMNCTGGFCKCGTYEYFNTGTLKCVSQSYANGPCVTDYHCRIDRGLQCKFGICQCNSSKPYWSAFSNICIQPYYFKQLCNASDECIQSLNLVCNSGSSCNCPFVLGNNQCDCKRVAGDEWYWNGTSCVPAAAVNQACTPFVNYTCQTLTQKSSCNSSGLCTCGTNGGLKSNGKCASCETGWVYIDEYCYRLGTMESNSSINATDYFIRDSCEAQTLVSYTARASVKLAVLSNVNVRSFFRNKGDPLQGYFVDAHLDKCGPNKCYVSTNGSFWNITNAPVWNITYTGPSSQWCRPATFMNCVYYNSSYDCFTDYCCVPSDCAPGENKFLACQYTADEN